MLPNIIENPSIRRPEPETVASQAGIIWGWLALSWGTPSKTWKKARNISNSPLHFLRARVVRPGHCPFCQYACAYWVDSKYALALARMGIKPGDRFTQAHFQLVALKAYNKGGKRTEWPQITTVSHAWCMSRGNLLSPAFLKKKKIE